MVKTRPLLIITVVVALLVARGCQRHQPSNESAKSPSVADSGSKVQYPGLKGIVVHTAGGFSETYDLYREFHAYDPLIQNIASINWIAPRGGAGIDPEDVKTKRSADVKAIAESSKEKPDYTGDFIRLQYDPQIPQAGENWIGHQDLLVYQDAEHEQDAYLAVQDPKQADQWRVYRLPDYGDWLSKELAIIFREHFGY